jgi:CDP-diacylglycerol--glycerol-3-phosphate 3-phosphatidyltransferase
VHNRDDSRDLVVDSLRFIAAGKGQVLAANIFGKIKTVCQMVAIPLFSCSTIGPSLISMRLGLWSDFLYLYVYGDFASLLSGVIYVVQNRSVFKEEKHE